MPAHTRILPPRRRQRLGAAILHSPGITQEERWLPAFRAATPFAISKASVGLPTSASLASRLAADDARAKLAPYLAFHARRAPIASIACPHAASNTMLNDFWETFT